MLRHVVLALALAWPLVIRCVFPFHCSWWVHCERAFYYIHCAVCILWPWVYCASPPHVHGIVMCVFLRFEPLRVPCAAYAAKCVHCVHCVAIWLCGGYHGRGWDSLQHLLAL